MVRMDKNINNVQYVRNPNMTMIADDMDFNWINAKKDFHLLHENTRKMIKPCENRIQFDYKQEKWMDGPTGVTLHRNFWEHSHTKDKIYNLKTIIYRL